MATPDDLIDRLEQSVIAVKNATFLEKPAAIQQAVDHSLSTLSAMRVVQQEQALKIKALEEIAHGRT